MTPFPAELSRGNFHAFPAESAREINVPEVINTQIRGGARMLPRNWPSLLDEGKEKEIQGRDYSKQVNPPKSSFAFSFKHSLSHYHRKQASYLEVFLVTRHWQTTVYPLFSHVCSV